MINKIQYRMWSLSSNISGITGEATRRGNECFNLCFYAAFVAYFAWR